MSGVVRKPYGKLKDGTPVDIYHFTNKNGLTAKVLTYGATLIELHVPDRAGKLGDVVLGFDDLSHYEKGHPFFGSTVGRVANRIAKGRFSLGGKEYVLAVNNGPNHLHGGLKGFDKRVWRAAIVSTAGGPSVRFNYVSPDGEEGYPGKLEAAVTYTLTDRDELRLEYSATTDKQTPVNLTNHTYFNLAGEGDVLNHIVQFEVDKYTPVDDTLIPTGELKSVLNTPFDFRKPTAIGARIDDVPGSAGGYDHNLVVHKGAGGVNRFARVVEPSAGRVMEASTTEPGFQFYTGNFLDGSLTGKRGVIYHKHAGFCLEAQHFPDSVNHPSFPSVILQPGQVYRQTTLYKFTTQK
jgi:aldose 1-epimerase